MRDTKISIVTPSLNSGNTISKTIEAVLQQTLSAFEYVIMDGGSTDNTLEIAKAYAERFLKKGIAYKIVCAKDDGIYHAMNKGISLCSGDVVGIINSDDWYEPCALEEVSNLFLKTQFDVMYANLRVVKLNGRSLIKKARYIKNKFSTQDWNHPTTFVKRQVYEKFPYVLESIYDDLDFMLNVREAGLIIAVLDKTLANFRLGGVSSKKSWRERSKRICLRNKIYAKHGQKNFRFNNWLIETAKFFLS